MKGRGSAQCHTALMPERRCLTLNLGLPSVLAHGRRGATVCCSSKRQLYEFGSLLDQLFVTHFFFSVRKAYSVMGAKQFGKCNSEKKLFKWCREFEDRWTYVHTHEWSRGGVKGNC